MTDIAQQRTKIGPSQACGRPNSHPTMALQCHWHLQPSVVGKARAIGISSHLVDIKSAMSWLSPRSLGKPLHIDQASDAATMP